MLLDKYGIKVRNYFDTAVRSNFSNIFCTVEKEGATSKRTVFTFAYKHVNTLNKQSLSYFTFWVCILKRTNYFIFWQKYVDSPGYMFDKIVMYSSGSIFSYTGTERTSAEENFPHKYMRQIWNKEISTRATGIGMFRRA